MNHLKRFVKSGAIIVLLSLFLFLPACSGGNSHDTIKICNRRKDVLDDIAVELPDGYFYYDMDKTRISEHEVELTIYFSNRLDYDEWRNTDNEN